MTLTPTTRTNLAPDDLDSFETALLGELRTTVQKRSAVRRRSRNATLGGLAAAAATAVGLSVTMGGASPAFAVDRQADGDVVVTIHRLSDADGLEQALADQGVTADVDYAHPRVMHTTDGRTIDVIPLQLDRPGSGGARTPVDCEFGDGGNLALVRAGGGYRLTIPRASVLAHTPLSILTVDTPAAEPEPGGGAPLVTTASLAVSYHDGRCVQLASAR